MTSTSIKAKRIPPKTADYCMKSLKKIIPLCAACRRWGTRIYYLSLVFIKILIDKKVVDPI